MDVIDISGIAELGKETELSEGIFVTLEPTRTPRKFYIRVTGQRQRPRKVRARQHIRKTLTDDGQSG